MKPNGRPAGGARMIRPNLHSSRKFLHQVAAVSHWLSGQALPGPLWATKPALITDLIKSHSSATLLSPFKYAPNHFSHSGFAISLSNGPATQWTPQNARQYWVLGQSLIRASQEPLTGCSLVSLKFVYNVNFTFFHSDLELQSMGPGSCFLRNSESGLLSHRVQTFESNFKDWKRCIERLERPFNQPDSWAVISVFCRTN